jgi:hypothetical protein
MVTVAGRAVLQWALTRLTKVWWVRDGLVSLDVIKSGQSYCPDLDHVMVNLCEGGLINQEVQSIHLGFLDVCGIPV